jgi:uncharacterized OB-fold protein
MSVEYNKGESIPVPRKYLDFQGFWQGADEGKLVLQKCGGCGTWCHIPQPMCPKCHSVEKGWAPVSGKGVVYSWVTYHESPHPAFKVPYSVVLVELEEGVRIVSNLVDVKPDEIEIGMPVEVTFDQITEGVTLPKFKRARSR